MGRTQEGCWLPSSSGVTLRRSGLGGDNTGVTQGMLQQPPTPQKKKQKTKQEIAALIRHVAVNDLSRRPLPRALAEL